jgi:hypothetical protein
MKLFPATALFTLYVGWVLALACPQQAIAECRDNHGTTGCATVQPDDRIRVIDNLGTTAATQRSAETPANFVAKAATLSADSAATASAITPLGLFGSALVAIGFLRRNRTVHRQLD